MARRGFSGWVASLWRGPRPDPAREPPAPTQNQGLNLCGPPAHRSGIRDAVGSRRSDAEPVAELRQQDAGRRRRCTPGGWERSMYFWVKTASHSAEAYNREAEYRSGFRLPGRACTGS